MKNKKCELLCSLIVLYKEEKILLQQRTEDAPVMPGYWAFFGGGIEEEESPLDAVKREAMEELCYKLKNPALVIEKEFFVEKRSGYMYVFIEEYDGRELCLNEGQAMGWFDKETINKIDKIIKHDKEVMLYILDSLESK